MSDLRLYRLVDKEGNPGDYLYAQHEYSEAEQDAADDGHAIVALIFEWADTELVWTPDGSTTWPEGSDT